MARRPEWVGSAMLGLVVVAVAGVAFYVTSPARRAKGVATTASTAAPPPPPMPLLAVVDAGPTPSGASSVMAKPPISPLGADDVLPDPPLAIASETPPPFDLPDGGCPPGCEATTTGQSKGCAHAGPDGGVVPNGPWKRVFSKDSEEGQMVEGVPVGPWRVIDAEGRQVRLRYYDHQGRIEGRELWWDAQGNVTAEVWYAQGQLHGVEIRRESGRVAWSLGRGRSPSRGILGRDR